ncbi:PqiC family protein [Idiomarina tyrosinivorans]|nr:ABC-type transport auxiliary lipoprotein family protein [Idiomarina tyrosinivorans]
MKNNYRGYALALLGLLIGACSSQPTKVEYYRLPSLNPAPQHLCSDAAVQLQLSPYLQTSGIFFQLSRSQWQAAKRHRWVMPLAEQLKRIAQRQASCEGELRLVVTDFYADNRQHAVVAGSWKYRASASSEWQQGPFYAREALANDGYPALIDALDNAWQRALTEIQQNY